MNNNNFVYSHVHYRAYLKDGTKTFIETFGIDFGSDLEIIDGKDNFYIVKVKGNESWVGIGLTKYFPTKYMLIETFVEDSFRYFRVYKQCEFGRKWKVGLKELKKEMIQMAKKKELEDKNGS